MPKVDPLVGLIGNIKRIEAMPCAIPPSIFVETGLEAAIQAFWSTQNFVPKIAIRALGGGDSWLCQTKTLAGELHQESPRAWDGSLRYLFSAAEWADHAVFWVFWADVATRGLFNWTSQVIKQFRCPGQGYPGAGTGTLWGGAIPDTGEWWNIDFYMPEGTIFWPVFSGGVGLRPGQTCTIFSMARFHDLAELPVNTSMRITETTRGLILDHSTSTWKTGDRQAKPGMVHATYTAPQGPPSFVRLEFSCGERPLPDHEAFPDDDSMCFLYVSGVHD